ncbi:hypothetical protein Ancab_022911 [Ancistrocladus abbreviatus]
MPPNEETNMSSVVAKRDNNYKLNKPPSLSMECLQRTISDISFELIKEARDDFKLPAVAEVEDAKCECCGMSEECTPGYIKRVRESFLGKLICGLCAEAVKAEVEKNGGKREEALNEHMSGCVKFNRIGRAYPALYQVETVKEILKKKRSSCCRGNSLSPIGKGVFQIKGGITRSSSCIPAITKEVQECEYYVP